MYFKQIIYIIFIANILNAGEIKVLEREYVNETGKTKIEKLNDPILKEEINKKLITAGYEKKEIIKEEKTELIPIENKKENTEQEQTKKLITAGYEKVIEQPENKQEPIKNIISNEKTIKCKNEEFGTEIKINNIDYLVVSNESIKDNLGRAETLCTSNITDMSNLFNGDIEFDTDISSWDTSNVSKMNGMFKDCQYFNQDISNWDVSNVKNMSEMFHGAIMFNKNISKWNISENTNVFNMFLNATEFNQDLSNWKKTNLLNSEDFLNNTDMTLKIEKYPK